MKCFLFIFMALAVSSCTAGDISVVREVTIDDGAAYIRENHDWRREIREMQRALVRETVAIQKAHCQAQLLNNDYVAARECLEAISDIYAAAYPNLATIELLREAGVSIQELRRVFSRLEEAPEERTAPAVGVVEPLAPDPYP